MLQVRPCLAASPVWVGSVVDFCDARPLACGLKLKRQRGGQVAHRLAHEASDLVAAAAASAGLDPVFGAAAPRPMSMVFVVGSIDDRFTTLIGGAEIPTTSDIGAVPGWQQLLSDLHQTLGLAPAPYAWQTMTAFGQFMSL